MIPRSAQSSLSHWTITRPGMVAGSRGTTSSSRPWAITIPPECWPRCRGRSWISLEEPREEPDAAVVRVEAGAAQAALEGVAPGPTYSKRRM